MSYIQTRDINIEVIVLSSNVRYLEERVTFKAFGYWSRDAECTGTSNNLFVMLKIALCRGLNFQYVAYSLYLIKISLSGNIDCFLAKDRYRLL
jgi:hypothetical protein